MATTAPKALLAEFDFLLAHRMIPTDEPFAMYWDDLVNIEMQTAFDWIGHRLREVCGGGWHGLH